MAWRVIVHDVPQFDVVVPTWREAQQVALAQFGAGFGVNIAPIDAPPAIPPLTDEEAVDVGSGGVSDSPTDPNLDLLYEAWKIIANAGEGDWTRETAEWQGAAVRWRDRFHARLAAELSQYRPRVVTGMGDADAPLTFPAFDPALTDEEDDAFQRAIER